MSPCITDEFEWYTAVLTTILKEVGFDMSKVMFAVTFSYQRATDDTELNAFVDKLWKTAGFEAQGIQKPYGRFIRHGKDSKPSDILQKVLALM